MSAFTSATLLAVDRPRRLQIAGGAALAGGLSHATFAAAGFVLSPLASRLTTLDYPASLVADYRWNGLLTGLFTFAWGSSLIAAVIALGALALDGVRFVSRFATAIGVTGGGIVLLSSGIAIAMYSGATADISLTGADIPTQQAVMQAAWVIDHACWYAGILAVTAWVGMFATAARSNGTFGLLGLILSFVAVLAVVAMTVSFPYPTIGVPLSLYLLVLGIVLLVRARKTRTSTSSS